MTNFYNMGIALDRIRTEWNGTNPDHDCPDAILDAVVMLIAAEKEPYSLLNSIGSEETDLILSELSFQLEQINEDDKPATMTDTKLIYVSATMHVGCEGYVRVKNDVTPEQVREQLRDGNIDFGGQMMETANGWSWGETHNHTGKTDSEFPILDETEFDFSEETAP